MALSSSAFAFAWLTIAFACTCVDAKESEKIVLVELEGESDSDHRAGLALAYQIFDSLSPGDLAQVRSIDWPHSNFSQLQEDLPEGLCAAVERLNEDERISLSRALLNDRVADNDWICMALAEYAPCAGDDNRCRAERLVPIAVYNEGLSQLYPYPKSPPCDEVVGGPLLADDPQLKEKDWFRQVVEWSAQCRVNGETVEFRYSHHEGWFRR